MARSRRTKIKLDDLPGLEDPTAAIDGGVLLAAARPVLDRLRTDLAERAELPGVSAALKSQYAYEKAANRTAASFAAWREGLLAQVAASWFLSCIFVRTLEDRGLIERARIAGPGATDSQELFLRLAPSLTERDYLLFVFRELAGFPAAGDLFDRDHALVWKLAPSADAAKELLRLFRTPTANAPAFRFGQASTRFLGDLYQDLYEDVRKRYALLQTPDFVESFILDRTLEPAIERFGLDDTTLIDPTCGSGHFLLGAFDRLFEHRLRAEPGIDVGQAATQALDAVYGADINPYAVAIARFRLTLAYLEKAEIGSIANAPALPLHLVVADSLLHNPHRPQTELAHEEGQSVSDWQKSDVFRLENEDAAREVLHRQYAAVVGNPPYITEKDKARRDAYREMYPRSAHRSFSLAAPFCERFFQLGREGGHVGQITANSFMKREFGKKLITDYLPSVNLELIVNTSGAFIPGHGTPTVLLFGTHETPTSQEVHTVLAKRGEPTTPTDPARGAVWSSISEHWKDLKFENDYISIAKSERAKLTVHPWSLAGGGATELKQLLEERAAGTLGELVDQIGRSTHTGEDGIFFMSKGATERLGFREAASVPLVKGEQVRDWAIAEDEICLFPYDLKSAEAQEPSLPRERQYYWRYRTTLRDRQDFGQKIEERGLKWFEHSMFFPKRYTRPLSIAFAFVATHNHFVLDRGGKVFKQSAPIIKLPETATEDDHLALLAYLNSSTACFWMKQVFYPKSSQRDLGDGRSKPESLHYEFTGTGMKQLPIPIWSSMQRAELVELAREALDLAEERDSLSGVALVEAAAAGQSVDLGLSERHKAKVEARLATIQEDIDWLVYKCFGLFSSFERTKGALQPNQRAFHVRQGGVARGKLPSVWERRYAELAAGSELQIIERPLYKRLWTGRRGVFGHGVRTLGESVADAVSDWAQQRAEEILSAEAATRSRPMLVQAVDSLAATASVVRLATSAGIPSGDRHLLCEFEAVPYLAALRFAKSGLKKHISWQDVWKAQRKEDAGADGTAPQLPPKFTTKDLLKPEYYRLRGKLDVPKERFISYPGCESDEDGEPVYGWAGWDHLQRALALGDLYQKRKDNEGWQADRLTPMLAGILELIPWVKQWHNEPNSEYGGLRMGDYFEGFVREECERFGLTKEDLESWRPPKKSKKRRAAGRSKKRAKKAEKDTAAGDGASRDPDEGAAG